MAATGYSLVISATDRATAPIRAVNRELTNLRAPITKTAEALKGLGQASGVTSALRARGSLSPALGALTAGATIAGIVAQIDSARASVQIAIDELGEIDASSQDVAIEIARGLDKDRWFLSAHVSQ